MKVCIAVPAYYIDVDMSSTARAVKREVNKILFEQKQERIHLVEQYVKEFYRTQSQAIIQTAVKAEVRGIVGKTITPAVIRRMTLGILEKTANGIVAELTTGEGKECA